MGDVGEEVTAVATVDVFVGELVRVDVAIAVDVLVGRGVLVRVLVAGGTVGVPVVQPVKPLTVSVYAGHPAPSVYSSTTTMKVELAGTVKL